MPSGNPLTSPQSWHLVADSHVDVAMPLLGRLGEEAIERAGIGADMHVVNVATGPGEGATRGNAPFEFVRRESGELEWRRLVAVMRDYLATDYGSFPLCLGSTANLGQGRKLR